MRTIAILSRWNATCGISLHAELIGREFIQMGYGLRVFAPYIESANKWWHHRIVRYDESYVKRCYEEVTPDWIGGAVNEEAILSEEFDFLIVESYNSLPYMEVASVIPEVKRRAKVIAVIHEPVREFIRYSLEQFDRIVVFDKRFREMLEDFERVEIIPYPCNPVIRGRRKFAEDGIKFFTFGRQPPYEYLEYIEALDSLSEEYEFTYKVIRTNGLLPYVRDWLIQERKKLDDVYTPLHGSDIHLIPKQQTRNIVVSSTLCQCLGSLIPTVAPNTRHFEMLPKINGVRPAVIYDNVADLREKLARLIEEDEFRRRIIRAAERYVDENRSDRIARTFISLLNSI